VFFDIMWIVNVFVYWILVSAVCSFAPTLIKYGTNRTLNKDDKVVYNAICGFTGRIQDYLIRHSEDFNALEFKDTAYKMLWNELEEGVQDRLLAEMGDYYSGKLRFGVYETPINTTERLNTDLEWGGIKYIGVQYGFRF